MYSSLYVVALTRRTTYIACASTHSCPVFVNAPSIGSTTDEMIFMQIRLALKALFRALF